MPKGGLSWIIRISVLVFLIYAAVNIVSLHGKIAEKKEELETLGLRVQEYELSNEELREEVQGGISDMDIGELARSELGYAAPGERIFVDTSSR